MRGLSRCIQAEKLALAMDRQLSAVLPITFDLSKLPPPSEDNRQKSLDMVRRYNEARAELEKRCKELGIPVPEMVC